MFWLASLTKSVTTVAALQLVEQGKLRYTDPVTKYLPEFEHLVVLDGVMNQPPPRPFHPTNSIVTVGQLFNHSSGLAYWLTTPQPFFALSHGYQMRQTGSRAETTKKFLETLQEGYPGIPLVFEPGSSFNYGYSIDILGIIVEKITGMSLNDYSKRHIFDPLGVGLTWRLNEELNSKLVNLNFRNADGSISPFGDRAPIPQRYPDEVRLALGGIGLFGTLPDYATYLRHLLRLTAGKKVDKPILKKRNTIKSLFEPRLGAAGVAGLRAIFNIWFTPNPAVPLANFDGANWSTGFALMTKDWPGGRRAGTGFWFGYGGLFYLVDPTTGIAIVTGTQIVPFPDPKAANFFHDVERIVYANLE